MVRGPDSLARGRPSLVVEITLEHDPDLFRPSWRSKERNPLCLRGKPVFHRCSTFVDIGSLVETVMGARPQKGGAESVAGAEAQGSASGVLADDDDGFVAASIGSATVANLSSRLVRFSPLLVSYSRW